MRAVALAADLMDRSKLTAAIPDLTFAAGPDGCAGADVVIVDLSRHAARIEELRHLLPAARIVGFGPHVDDEQLEAARAAGADVVLPRSRFFRDPLAAITGA